jgi:hypothetical protein
VYELSGVHDPDSDIGYPISTATPRQSKEMRVQLNETMEDETATNAEKKSGFQVVTIEEAFDKCGGFGKFQKISATFLVISMGLSQCFLYSFPFLELVPKFGCRKSESDNEYTPCGAKDVCQLGNDKLWRYIWEDRETVNNLII